MRARLGPRPGFGLKNKIAAQMIQGHASLILQPVLLPAAPELQQFIVNLGEQVAGQNRSITIHNRAVQLVHVVGGASQIDLVA